MGGSTKEEKTVKKEDPEKAGEDGKTLSSLRQAKKKTSLQSVNGAPSARSTKAAAKIKKEEPKDEDDEEDEKPIAMKLSKVATQKAVESKDKKKIKKKKQVEEEENAAKKKRTAGENDKREKKVYDLPGQKHDPPEERDPLRIFYESLYKQLPESEMAAFWMMEWGLLPPNEAKVTYEKKLKKKQQGKLDSPAKNATIKKTSITVTKKTVETKVAVKASKKQKVDISDGDDDDFVPIKKVPKKAIMDANSDDGDDDFISANKKKVKKQKISS